MKKTIILLCLMASGIVAQNTIQYTYKNGSRVQQKLEVCLNCRNNTQTGGVAAQKDTAQEQIVVKHEINVFPNPTQDRKRDALDAGVGLAGIAAFFFLSNPVDWGIGSGVLIYGSATMLYDPYNEKQ